MKIVNTVVAAAAFAFVLVLGGCAAEPTQTEREFGDSVRHMIQAQTYDPSAPTSDEAVDGTDGVLLEGVLETYRGDAGNRGAVNDTIVVGPGEGNSQ